MLVDLSENAAHRIDHDLPRIKTDSGRKPRRATLARLVVQVSDRLLDGEGCAHRAFGVVFPRLRVTEHRRQAVAKAREHMPVELAQSCRGRFEIGDNNITPIFRIEFGDKIRRIKSTKQESHETALDGVVRGDSVSRRCSARRTRLQRRDRLDQALAGPERDAEPLEIGFGQVGQDVPIDIVFAKPGFVLAEANAMKPLADRHDPALSRRLSPTIDKVSRLGQPNEWSEHELVITALPQRSD